jgi:type III restriction enzyme
VETKSRVELDLPQKMNWLKQWCEDATAASANEDGVVYRFVYVDQAGFEKHAPSSFSGLVNSFTEYQNAPPT